MNDYLYVEADISVIERSEQVLSKFIKCKKTFIEPIST